MLYFSQLFFFLIFLFDFLFSYFFYKKKKSFAWENITQKHEEIIAKELDRQRRLIITEQVERTQRIGRIKMTQAVHSYEFEEALRLVDEEEIAIDVETLYGYTALGLAASEGTESVNDEGVQVLAVEMLLDRLPGKIRPAINRETNGMTPLMWAANHGNVDVAESLIDRVSLFFSSFLFGFVPLLSFFFPSFLTQRI